MTAYAYAWDPVRDVETMFAGMDRLFHHPAGLTPRINVYASEDTAVVTSELPGVAASDLHVQVHEDVLTLDAQRGTEPTEHYRRRLNLPFAVDPEHVKAQLTNGVLTITITRAAADKPRRIPVSAN